MACSKGKQVTKQGSVDATSESYASPDYQNLFFNAQLEKSRGNMTKAAQLFQECMVMDPGQLTAQYENARIQLEFFNNPTLAISQLRPCIEADRNNPWFHKSYADAQMASGKYDLAAKSYARVYELNPDDSDVLYDLAGAYMFANKHKDALEVLDKVETYFGIYEELTAQKVQLCLSLKDEKRAGEELIKLASAHPFESRYWTDAVNFYLQSGATDKGMDLLKKMLESNPDNGAAHYTLSEYYASKGDDASSYIELVKAFSTQDVGVDQRVGVLLRYYNATEVRKDWISHAYELLESSLKIFPDEPKLFSMRGDFKTRDGDLQGALADYKRVIQKGGANKVVWERILELEFSLGSEFFYDDSYAAMTYYPASPEFYLYHAYACQFKNQHAEAIRVLRNGKELVIDNAALSSSFYSGLGDSYFHLGNAQECFDAMESALKYTPSDALILNNYAYYLAENKSSLDKAASMSAKANELQLNDASYEDTFAWICYKQAKYEMALQWIERSILHDSKQAEALAHKGDILCKLGRITEAHEAWLGARALGLKSEKLDQKITSRQCID
jgi:tetratricopeptide (TPR) repeat protein